MQVPDPRQVNNGGQRGAVVSDIEVVPDTEDEVAMPSYTMADRHAMSDDMSFEDEVSCQPIQVNVRCANNFDIGRTVVDQLPGNLQSQQFREGQAAGPRPPGSRNETTHASFV